MIRYTFPESYGKSHAEWQLQQDAEAHRRAQAQALIELYRRSNGRKPNTVAELEAWVVTVDLSKPIDPYPILAGIA